MISEQPRWKRRKVPDSLVATRRTGVTLAELLVVVAMMAIVLGYASLRLAQAADRTAVRSAVAEATTAFNGARQAAITRQGPVAVLIDTVSLRLNIVADSQVLRSRDLGAEYGVRLGSTRDSMAYDARGLGLGAANLSLVVRRGRAAETVFVSRLGRVRH
jgi:prepilin-type N-terminal cleavage/methylation domain-containing protein